MKSKQETSTVDSVLAGLCGGMVSFLLIIAFVLTVMYVHSLLLLLVTLALLLIAGPLFCYEVMISVYMWLANIKEKPPKKALAVIWLTLLLFLSYTIFILSV